MNSYITASQVEAKPGPPRYDNAAKRGLLFFAVPAIVAGLIIAVAAGSGIANGFDYVDRDYGTISPEQQLASAETALRLGVVVLVLGAAALFAYLVARSVTYDLMYRFGPRPDYVTPDGVAPTMTQATEPEFTEARE